MSLQSLWPVEPPRARTYFEISLLPQPDLPETGIPVDKSITCAKIQVRTGEKGAEIISAPLLSFDFFS